MVRRFGSTHGGWTIDHLIGDHDDTVFFPVGRSDRMYVLESNSDNPTTMSCWKRLEGRDRLVYRVRRKEGRTILTRHEPGRRSRPETSLIDYLTAPITGSVGRLTETRTYRVLGSRLAIADLAAARRYVKYGYDIPVDWLTISVFPSGDRDDPLDRQETYDTAEDPLTKDKLNTEWVVSEHGVTSLETRFYDEEFFKKYGLPVSQADLDYLARRIARPVSAGTKR